MNMDFIRNAVIPMHATPAAWGRFDAGINDDTNCAPQVQHKESSLSLRNPSLFANTTLLPPTPPHLSRFENLCFE